VILYVETNLLMGIAKGQEPQAEDFLLNIPTSIHLVMPSICYLEALTTLEQEDKYSQDFLNRLNIQINEAERDKTSQNAKLLRNLLDESRILFNRRKNDIRQRFFTIFNQLSSEAEMIGLNNEIFQESFGRNILEKHIIDKIILECIIHHARLHNNETKVFLSSNSNEFGKREVSEILQNMNIHYFNKTQNFLGWLQSQSS
jgi:PIN domain